MSQGFGGLSPTHLQSHSFLRCCWKTCGGISYLIFRKFSHFQRNIGRFYSLFSLFLQKPKLTAVTNNPRVSEVQKIQISILSLFIIVQRGQWEGALCSGWGLGKLQSTNSVSLSHVSIKFSWNTAMAIHWSGVCKSANLAPGRHMGTPSPSVLRFHSPLSSWHRCSMLANDESEHSSPVGRCFCFVFFYLFLMG